jgi:nucleoside-diphosphate-sugar epimerase
MRIVIAGGHGKIAMLLHPLLAGRGDRSVGLIRNLDQAEELRAAGSDPVVCDLEKAGIDKVAQLLGAADAVVFAAGAGPGSGAARKTTVDRDAAILLADAAIRAGVGRYIMVSAMGVDSEPPAGTDDVFAAYLRAKGEADDYLRKRDELAWTVLRPGRLTDEPGTGRVRLATHTGRGEIPRADVAAVLAALLNAPNSVGRTFDLIGGDTSIAAAIDSLG